MNPAISNLAIMLIMMQVSKKLNFEDPNVVFYVRAAFVTATLFTLGVYFYTKSIINRKNDLTTLKFVTPPNAMAGETEEKLEVTTVKDYDLKQVEAAIKGVYTSLAMMAFMHLYMKYTNPLVMQSISPVKSALESNIVQIHVFGKAASGDLKRPFKAASMFGGFGGQDTVKTDKHSIEQAEKAGNGGVKQE
ncbi:Inorganic phosphate transport protein PHO88 [Wickerhamomyces ciferrii]|uniref:Inorganic phosphate transport protein PHO88 n=1 Tax=Wickerhamomyces ciferrii (strain ATCC 14091 / BCRC 22168 / CBS 111 / JCM 3599 / NBRC 0793 / NRRL Y-1031 F-60-10) TaxID=1206466 RepID=K0KS93_WICCF|nr:Inorganic phosphate transport protein PHO88 [Wickerhamomyces ciferrii]CCH46036.1 Inorganic phosphate transport protein PHO88 [Wickerhamomyces ciferrii]